MQTQLMAITVKKAREFLDHNVQYERGISATNRPISLRTVNIYARDMLLGRWRVTHQGIGFSKNTKLKDGQHRLLAIMQAGEEGAYDGDMHIPPNPKISIQMQVTFGLPDDIFDVLDMGRLRSGKDVLAMAGYANSLNLTATGRLVYLYDNYDYKYWKSTRVPNHEILQQVINNRLDEYIPICSKLVPVGFISSAAAAGYFVCERAHSEGNHESFIEGLTNGAGLAIDDPRLILRNYMMRSKGQAGVRRDAYLHLALYIKTWNDFVAGRRRNSISWRSTEAFPHPVATADVKNK